MTSLTGDPAISGREVVAAFTIAGQPASKARPRFTHANYKSRAFTPEHTRVAEEMVGHAFLAATKERCKDTEVTFGVLAHFYSGTRQRRDVDNMMKLILDGLNKIAFPDDAQVVEIIGRKSVVPRAEARTEVVLYRVGQVDRLTKPCKSCGEEFVTWPSLADKTQFCSRKCRNEYRRRARTSTCRNCGKDFLAHGPAAAASQMFCGSKCKQAYRNTEVRCSVCGETFTRAKCLIKDTNNYCSKACTNTAEAAKKRGRKSPMKGTCQVCGAGTTKPQYLRCNACRVAGKQIPKPIDGLVDAGLLPDDSTEYLTGADPRIGHDSSLRPGFVGVTIHFTTED